MKPYEQTSTHRKVKWAVLTFLETRPKSCERSAGEAKSRMIQAIQEDVRDGVISPGVEARLISTLDVWCDGRYLHMLCDWEALEKP